MDVALFKNTIDYVPGLGEFKILSTQDVTKEGIYPISYRAYYSKYPSNFVDNSSAFTITVIDPCDDPVSFTASALTD